jgi:hypothetical protein
MNMNITMGSVLVGIRRHPARAAAIAVPVLIAASVVTSTTIASARPQATLAVPASALTAPPAQHVLLFHNDLPKTGAVVKTTPVKVAFNEDGCDHDYGPPNDCVPWQIPGSSTAAQCAWLKSMGFGALKVYGTNRQHLPENAQGYICASGE